MRDLAREDFALFEDGTPQKIEQFELVEVLGSVPQETRREPSTVTESREMAREDPRARVFLIFIFLDTYHVDASGSHRMRIALSTLLRRILSPDDLVGVMTPEMSAGDVTLSRRTDVTEGMLEKYWNWGRRNQVAALDPEEAIYVQCYPHEVTGTQTGGLAADDKLQFCGVAAEMIQRRRDKLTLNALADLVAWVREERKAVITISDGWRLFRPNPALERVGGRRSSAGSGPGPRAA